MKKQMQVAPMTDEDNRHYIGLSERSTIKAYLYSYVMHHDHDANITIHSNVGLLVDHDISIVDMVKNRINTTHDCNAQLMNESIY